MTFFKSKRTKKIDNKDPLKRKNKSRLVMVGFATSKRSCLCKTESNSSKKTYGHNKSRSTKALPGKYHVSLFDQVYGFSDFD